MSMQTIRHRQEISWLFQTALLLFVVTVVIGIANGTKIFGTLDRNVLLTHLHSGTIGWITIAAVAMALWLFGTAPSAAVRPLTLLMIVSTPLYIAAFFSGNLPARAVTGVLLLIGILGFWGWILVQAREVGWRALSAPQLAVVLSFSTLVIGSTLGVLVQVALATGVNIFGTASGVGGHAAAQIAGYLVLLAIGACEWLLRRTTGRHWVFTLQALLLFVAGLALSLGALLNVIPLLGLAQLLQIVATVIFIGRMTPAVLRAPWSTASAERHFAAAAPFLVANLALLIYVISIVVAAGGFAEGVGPPRGPLLAADHAIFVGVMSNVIFGLIRVFTGSDRSSWADHVLFWGMNIGVAAFVVVLLVGGTGLERVTAPVMGVSILLGIVISFVRLRAVTRASAPESPSE